MYRHYNFDEKLRNALLSGRINQGLRLVGLCSIVGDVAQFVDRGGRAGWCEETA